MHARSETLASYEATLRLIAASVWSLEAPNVDMSDLRAAVQALTMSAKWTLDGQTTVLDVHEASLKKSILDALAKVEMYSPDEGGCHRTNPGDGHFYDEDDVLNSVLNAKVSP
jgi:hypothetical protein